MVFEHIEQLKRDFTDKYVVVDAERPELRRFEGQTGVVKTVNMNGSALVEFDGLNNIGWFDIGLDYLKVVDKPLPKEEPKKAPAKKAAKPAAKAAKKEPAKAAGGGAKMSVAEMLAAARGEKGGDAPAKAAPAAEAPAKKPAPAKAGGKMSVAEMLAAARAEKSDGGAAPAEAAPAPEPAPEPEPAAEAPAAAPAGDLPKDTEGICAYCRKVDG